MARKLTPDQRRIVETLDRPLFVAAGAGSGKSSTLAERVAWALMPGSGADGGPYIANLDEVLVITFTHLAADEIKEKIRERLREGGMEAQALAVDSAWISTIHGMCARILRRHAFDLGIDPGFSVLEAHDASQLVERATNEVLRTLMREHSYPELFKVFPPRSRSGGDTAGSVFGMVGALRDAAGSALAGFDSLSFPGVPVDGDDVLQRLLVEHQRALALGLDCKAFSSVKGAAEEARLQAAIEVLEAHFRCAPGERKARAAETFAQVGKPGDAYRKDAMKEVGASLKATYAEAALAIAFAGIEERSRELVEIARMVEARYRALKLERGALDNDDLLSWTFAAFREHQEIAEQYGNKFRLVMVDEFQDTNAQQVRMIELLSGVDACHLATVGDAQQSIYRFRAADVQVFRDREHEVDADALVRLAMNFRSHDDILKFVERTLAGPPLPDFMPLEACTTRPDGYRAHGLPRVDVELLSTPGRKGANAEERSIMMAALIADRIAERVAAGERPQDVALLLGRMSKLAYYLDALRARGLDCVVTGGSTFSNAPEVRLVVALMRTLANPKDTQSGLFSVLVSELFSLEADDLCMLATRDQETVDALAKRGIDAGFLGFELPLGSQPSPRLRAAHDVLTRAMQRTGSWRLADVLLGVLVESGWVERMEHAGADGQAKLANALAAVRYAGDLADAAGLGIARAASEFARWLDLSKIAPATLSAGEGGAVRVMTVHASKGLEFPLVAIAECWGSGVGPSVTGVTCENRAGNVIATLVPVGMHAADLALGEDDELRPPAAGADVSAWARYITAAAREGDEAERARLLYVAITRARESVILGITATYDSKGIKPRLANEVVGTLFGGELPPAGEGALAYGGSEPARLRHVAITGDAAERTIEPATFAPLFSAENDSGPSEGFELIDVRDDDGLAAVRATAGWERPRTGVFSYSSAHARMAEAAQAEGGHGSGHAVRPVEAPAPRSTVDEEDLAAPERAFDPDKATNLGSAFHVLAQTMVEGSCDHSEERLEALARRWTLSPRQRTRLAEAIERWECSELRREACSYDVVRPEVPFFVRVESAYGTYVEGAVDLLCTNAGSKEALVVDYKTGDLDLTPAEVRARHEMQANFYAYVMMRQGYEAVTCSFVCVEYDRGDGEPLVVSYHFDAAEPPRI